MFLLLYKYSLSSVVKYLIGQSTLKSSLEGNINVESDCEGDPQELGEETQKATEVKEEPVRAVLIAGSFSAYALLRLHFSREE